MVDVEKTKIEGLPPICNNYLDKLEVPTKTQLDCLAKGVDFLAGPSKEVTLIDLLAGTRIKVEHQEPFDLTVIWTDPPRPMICLEPWTSPREAIISGDRILVLEPNAQQELKCRFISD